MKLTRLIAPWWKEKPVVEKEQRIAALDVEATQEVSRAERVIQSYRDASLIIATLRK